MDQMSVNQSHNKKVSLIPFLLIIVSFVGGYYFHQYKIFGDQIPFLNDSISTTSSTDNEPAGFSNFWKVWDLLKEKYLDSNTIDDKKLIDGAISGMVASLGDPYTSYFNQEDNVNFKDSLEGIYEGIGAQLGFKDNQLAIIAPMESSPAMLAGVHSGDLIIAVDGVSTVGWSVPQAVDKIRGDAGTSVKLTLVRGDGEPFDLSIERKEIQIPAVKLIWRENNIAQIKVLRFGSDTNGQWDSIVREVLSKKANGVILDVRNNPGGLLDSAIHLGSEFFNSGVVVKRQTNDDTYEFGVDHRCSLCLIKTVVLINEGSASASEILAGALQSRERAELIGTKSFGKGTVQEAVDLSSGTAIHVTTAKWLLPNDQNIHKVGLTPDIEVELNDTDTIGLFDDSIIDNQLQKALEVINQ